MTKKKLWQVQYYDLYGVDYYLLQVKFLPPSQAPFHFRGGGEYPLSPKLFDSGQMPLSITPMIVSLSVVGFLFDRLPSLRPMKSQDIVVWSLCFSIGNTDTTPSMPKVWKTKMQINTHN